jgi:hypothetical protein
MKGTYLVAPEFEFGNPLRIGAAVQTVNVENTHNLSVPALISGKIGLI